MQSKIPLVCVVASLFVGCVGQENPSATPPQSLPASAPPATPPTLDVALDSAWREQKLIREGYVVVEVESVASSSRDIGVIADSHDALVADIDAEQDGDGDRRSVIAIRVPSSRFDAAMQELRNLGTVARERVTTDDVTKQYADIETRLAVKKEAETRLRGLLSSRTRNLADVLKVERELSRVVVEIEQLEGERRYYDQRIALSTITIELLETRAALRASVFAPVGSALADSLSVLATSVGALIYLVAFSSPWMVLAMIGWWSWMWFGPRRRRT